MKKGKMSLILLSAAVLLAVLALSAAGDSPAGSAGPVTVRAGNENLEAWTADGEAYYVFLPGHSSPETAQVCPVQECVTLDGQALPSAGAYLLPGHTYSLDWQEKGSLHRGTLTVLVGGNVASMHIDTRSGSMEYIHEEKGNAERGSMRLYDARGELNYSGSLASVRGRGNSTWAIHDKKPYSLELTHAGDLLEMGAAKKWVLLADALDMSALRNRIVLDFASELGFAFTPQCRWTELYLNGQYAGLYLLCEKVEVDPQRLDLGPDGSLVCMDRDIRIREEQDPVIVTQQGQHLQVRKSADIGSLSRKLQAVEDGILSDGDSWKAQIDMDSWVRKYLVEEVFGSYDAGFQSQYYFWQGTRETEKLYAGPVWDYDSSLGNPLVWSLNSPRGLYAWRPEAMVDYATPWLHGLYQKPEFREELEKTYRELFLPRLEALLAEGLADYVQTVETAYGRNSLRWNVSTEGIHAEAAHIADYLRERMDFLFRFLAEDEDYCILRLREGSSGGYYGYYAVETGTVFSDLPDYSGENFLGWYQEDTGEPFDPDAPVREDLCLYPKYDGVPAAAPPREKGLRDLLLSGYHYVPFAVLLLMGLGAGAVSGIRHRAGKKSGQKTGVS